MLIHADVRRIPLADGSVQCVVTSPPYWSLRDYGLPPSIFGDDPLCEHVWGDERLQREEGGWHRWKPNDGREHNTVETRIDPESHPSQGSFCTLCGCWQGCLGLEPDPELYVAHMVEIFREVRRVLRDDGTCWLNLGDSYANTGVKDPSKVGGFTGDRIRRGVKGTMDSRARQIPSGLKPKDLVGIPWAVAKALQAPYYMGKIKRERDRVWLAAVLDTDGSICGFRHIRKDNGSERTGIHINVTNCNTALLDECFRIWPTSRHDHNAHGKGHYGSLPTYRWIAHNVDSKALLLRELYPYFVGKQRQALLAWNLLELSRDAKRLGKSKEAEAVREKRRWIVGAISELNHYKSIDIPSWIKKPPTMYEPGWWLRSDIIWAKKSPMPESVRDRPTKSHEYVFLLTKSKRYYYDIEAIREPQVQSSRERAKYGWAGRVDDESKGARTGSTFQRMAESGEPIATIPGDGKRNKRTVWTIAGKGYKGAHFATFPPALVEPCILAGTSAKGCCPICKAPWGRVTEKTGRERIPRYPSDELLRDSKMSGPPSWNSYETTGWRPTCDCSLKTWKCLYCGETLSDVDITPDGEVLRCGDCGNQVEFFDVLESEETQPHDPVPCLVLDPFCGSGTTGMVAIKHGRNFIGLDLSKKYLHELAQERLNGVQVTLL